MDSSNSRKGYLHYFGATDVTKRRRKQGMAFSQRSTLSPVSFRPASSAFLDSPEHSGSELDDSSDSPVSEIAAIFNRADRLASRRRIRRSINRRRHGAGAVVAEPDEDVEVDGVDYQLSDYCITSAQYSAQGDVLLASYNDDDIYVFDSQRPSNPYLHKYTGHRNMPTIVSATFFGPNSEYIVSGSDDGFFYIWDRESEGIVQWLFADATGAVNVVESHPTLPILASAGLDYNYKLWAPIRPLQQEPYYEYQAVAGPEHRVFRGLRNYTMERYLFPEPAQEGGSAGNQESLRNDRGLPDSPPETSTPQMTEPVSSTRKRTYETLATSAPRSLQTESDQLALPSGSQVSGSTPLLASPDEPSSVVKLPKRENCPETNLSDVGQQASCSSTGTGGETNSNDRCLDLQVQPLSSTTGLGMLAPASLVQSVLPPQSLMPFKLRDLQLRVAQNWTNRLHERSRCELVDLTLMYILPEVAEPLSRLSLPWMTPTVEALWSDTVGFREQDELLAALTDNSLSTDDEPVVASQGLPSHGDDNVGEGQAQDEDVDRDADERMESSSSGSTSSSMSSCSDVL